MTAGSPQARDAEWFTAPEQVSQRRYEALRAFFVASGQPYQDLGGDYFLRRHSPQRRARQHLHDLERLGWTITHTDQGVICQPPVAA